MVQSPWEPSARGPGTESEVGLVFLELHHEVMNIDELGPGWQRPELRLRQHPVEAMVELDQLGQRPLHRDDSQGSELHRNLRHSWSVTSQRKQQGNHQAWDTGKGWEWQGTWMMLVPFLKLVKLRMTS